MALSNAQYDEIMRGYHNRQLQNRHLTQERLEQLYATIPQLKSINDAIASLSVEAARKKLADDLTGAALIKDKIEDLKEEKAALLQHYGFDDSIFDSVYTCKDCKDTGYINGEKCHCFKQEVINVVYAQSNIKNILSRENFNHFSYEYYSDEDINPTTGLSSLETARRAVHECQHFIEDFDNKPKNLFLYGNTGVGKTFLTNCVAKELIDSSHSVIYVSAIRLFEILAGNTFKRSNDNAAPSSDLASNLHDCDLLIIDDLGTELVNSFTASAFFNCINERHLRQKSVIISTNLSLAELRANYSERVFSRITSNYTLLKIYGDDLRMKLR